MLDKFTKQDLLPGMRIVTRDGEAGELRVLSVRFDHSATVMIDDYSDDLLYVEDDTEDDLLKDVHVEHDLDIMRVALPSGAVLWERPTVELRVFDVELYKALRNPIMIATDEMFEALREYHAFKTPMWYDACNGKLCTFASGGNVGRCDGYSVHRAWTRELTDEERKNWRKKA